MAESPWKFRLVVFLVFLLLLGALIVPGTTGLITGRMHAGAGPAHVDFFGKEARTQGLCYLVTGLFVSYLLYRFLRWFEDD